MQLYTYVFADTNNENMYDMILVFVITKYKKTKKRGITKYLRKWYIK